MSGFSSKNVSALQFFNGDDSALGRLLRQFLEVGEWADGHLAAPDGTVEHRSHLPQIAVVVAADSAYVGALPSVGLMRYLTFSEVLELHRRIIHDIGGAAGVRDLAGVQSAVAQPLMTFDGEELYRTLEEKAAAIWRRTRPEPGRLMNSDFFAKSDLLPSGYGLQKVVQTA